MKAKSVTDINQSRELSKFLALENADFGWNIFSDGSTRLLPIDDWDGHNGIEFVPAWSLSALLDELDDELCDENGITYRLKMSKEGTYYDMWYEEEYDEADPIEVPSNEELIDVCVELLIELNKKNLI